VFKGPSKKIFYDLSRCKIWFRKKTKGKLEKNYYWRHTLYCSMAYLFYVRKIHENVFSRSFWKPSAIYKEQRKNNLDLHICSLPPTLQCTQSRKKRRGISTSCLQGWLVFTRTVVYPFTHTKIQSHNSIRWLTHIAAYWYFGVIPSICLDDISLNNVSANVPLPSGIYFISWTMCPRTMRPLDDVSLTDVSRPFVSDRPYAGIAYR
jgi:hypothetical protein